MGNPDFELVTEVIYGEWRRLSQDERGRSRWIMDPGMWAFIRQSQREHFSPELRHIMWPDGESQVLLLGKPVELQDGVEGIRLVAA